MQYPAYATAASNSKLPAMEGENSISRWVWIRASSAARGFSSTEQYQCRHIAHGDQSHPSIGLAIHSNRRRPIPQFPFQTMGRRLHRQVRCIAIEGLSIDIAWKSGACLGA
jgi:hypothetical protein